MICLILSIIRSSSGLFLETHATSSWHLSTHWFLSLLTAHLAGRYCFLTQILWSQSQRLISRFPKHDYCVSLQTAVEILDFAWKSRHLLWIVRACARRSSYCLHPMIVYILQHSTSYSSEYKNDFHNDLLARIQRFNSIKYYRHSSDWCCFFMKERDGCRKVYAGKEFEWQTNFMESKETFLAGYGRNYANS